jgi:hypothetical protein
MNQPIDLSLSAEDGVRLIKWFVAAACQAEPDEADMELHARISAATVEAEWPTDVPVGFQGAL